MGNENIKVAELYKSGQGSGHNFATVDFSTNPPARTYKLIEDSKTLVFRISGTADTSKALSALADFAPSEIGSLVKGNLSVEPQHVDKVYPESSIWTGQVEYVSPAAFTITPQIPDVNQTIVEFSISSHNHRIKNSIKTVFSKAKNGNAPNFNRAIHVSSDNSIEGIDIIVPSLTVDVTKTYRSGTESIPILESMVGKVNSNVVEITDSQTGVKLTAKPGEALLVGARGGRAESDGKFRLSLQLSIMRNEENFSLADIPGFSKKGWEYVWVYYTKSKCPETKRMILTATAGYVEQVYQTAEFKI